MKSREIRGIVFAILALGTCTSISGKVDSTAPLPERLTIVSKILNEERTVLIRVPPGYAKGDEKFPVIFMLDGRAPLLNLMTGTIEHLVWSGLIPEMILVSIPNTDRGRDMTPREIAGVKNGGGAKNFLLFLQHELMPAIEKSCRVEPFRILAGHSLSGLFTAYAFATKPDLFNAYLAASPGLALPWDSGFVKRQAEHFLPTKSPKPCTLFYAIGDEPGFIPGFTAFQQLLDRLMIKGLDYTFLQLPEENHWSTVSIVFQKGLRKVWEQWYRASNTDSASSLSEIEDRYRWLERNYGYKFPIPEHLLNETGYRALANGNRSTGIKIFERTVEMYPNSANAFDSLAEALEKDGQLKKAAENYTKALALAQKAGNQRLAESIKNNLNRLKEKNLQ